MATTNENPLGHKSPTSKTIHVGLERFEQLRHAAIDISAASRRQITASWLNKYILDNFMEQGIAKLLAEFNAKNS